MPDVSLIAVGRAYAGWKAMQVTSSIEQVCGAFTLSVSDEWPNADTTQRIRAGDACEVWIGTERVITGYVDAVDVAFDGQQHSIELTGRDRAADLVDCSAVRKSGQWRGLRVEQIAAELATPFGVTVTAEVDTGKPLTSFALQEGETVFEAIARAAAMRALLAVSNGRGGVVITRAGVDRIATPLVLGSNLLAARARLDLRDRYSVYLAKGQAPGTDFFSGSAAAHIAAQAADPGVERYRPLVMTADAPDIAATLTQRVQWEANVRAARAIAISATVQGWEHADGLWRTNRTVRMRAEALRIDADLLVSAVTFKLDESGTTTELTLTRADAYTLLPLKVADMGAVGASFWALPQANGAAR